MKYLLTKKTIAFLAVFIIIAVAFGYYLDFRCISVLKTASEIDKYEVRSKLLMEAMNDVGACSPEQAAQVWANGLKTRSAARQYSVMTKELKDEYARQLEESFPNWVTGVSSPWVDSFEITNTHKQDENTYIYTIIFSTKTSTGPAGDYNAVITVVREGSFWRISKINADKELYVYTGFMPARD